MHIRDEDILGCKKDTNPEVYRRYFVSNNIKTAFVVYTDEQAFQEMKDFCPIVDIYGFYWVHELNDTLHENADAIKFESYIDGIDIYDICRILDSDERNLTVYIHCGELKSELSNPKKVEQLAKLYPERKIIIGHSGAYGPPVDETDKMQASIIALVSDALCAAANNENIYLDKRNTVHNSGSGKIYAGYFFKSASFCGSTTALQEHCGFFQQLKP